MFTILVLQPHTFQMQISDTYLVAPHYVPDRRILFKKSLIVLKRPFGSPEVPYAPKSHNSLIKKIPIQWV